MVGAKQFAINRKRIEPKKINHLVRSIIIPDSMKSHEAAFKKMPLSTNNPLFFSNMMKKKEPIVKKEERVEHTEMDISDEIADRITYKVLRNIKQYLNKDQGSIMGGGRHIKLEISL